MSHEVDVSFGERGDHRGVFPVRRIEQGNEGQAMMTMADIKFYEQGRVPGDFLVVQDAIERRREWAIVRDQTGCASFLSPTRPCWQVIVNGVLVKSCSNRADAEWEMRGYLDGWYWIPWDVRPVYAQR